MQPTLFRRGELGEAVPAPEDGDRTGWPEPGDGRWLWTARYANKRIAESDLVPVRFSRGYPRFRLAYPLSAYVSEIAPDRDMLALNGDDSERRYRAKLDGIGFAAISTTLCLIGDAWAGRGLVLLCFEDLRKPAASCHRRSFARWFEERGGEAVRELAE